MNRAMLTLACAAVLALGLGCGRGPGPRQTSQPTTTQTAPWPLRLEPSPLAIAPDSVGPQLTGHDGGVVLSWLEQTEGAATLRFAERTADGWTPARSVASGTDWFISWADVPSVVRLPDGTLVAQWLKNVDPLIEAYDLVLSSSKNDGRTWGRPFAPHHDKTRTQHGFASLFAWPGSAAPGGFGVVWLDGRDMELDTTDPDGGSMSLYAARFDAGGTQVSEAPIDDRVCECCSTSVAVTSDGPIAAFRDRSLREIRDINVTRFEGGAWTPARPVHVDNWNIDSCPVNGPGIAASGRHVAVSWFTVQADQGHAYVALSSDAGRTWGEPVRLDDATSLGHVGVTVLDDGSAVASWVEFDDQRARLRARRVDAAGQRSDPVDLAGSGTGRVSGHPRVARLANELVFAWTESSGDGDGRTQVKVATARVPVQ